MNFQSDLRSINIPVNKTTLLDKSVSQSLLYRITGLGVVFFSQVLLARLMGTKGYGDYTVILSALNILLTVSLFGFDTAILRFLPSSVAKKESGMAHGVVRYSYRVITVISVICSIGIFVFLLSRSKKFNVSFAEGVFWSMLLLPFLAFLYQAGAVLRAVNKYKLSMLPVYFLVPVFISLSSLYYYYTYHRLPVDAVMFINLACTAGVCFYINRKAGKVLKQTVPVAEPESRAGMWMKVSSVLFLTSLLSMLLKQSDILIVSMLLGNAKAGIYSAASRVSTLVALGLAVTEYVFTPKIAALWEAKKKTLLQNGIRDASRQILIITVPMAVVLMMAGRVILGFFGEAFTASYVPMVILIAGQLVNAATGMVGGMLTMTGNQRMFLFFYLLGAVTQIALNFLLVPVFGLNGAALGSAVALALVNVLGYYYLKKKFRISASVF